MILEKKVGCCVFKYKTSKKEAAFHYFLEQLAINWIMSNPDKEFKENDLSTLKVMLLLFFTCAASASDNDEGLLKIFDNFVAMPLGHIEADVWDILKYKNNIIGQFRLTNKSLEVINSY